MADRYELMVTVRGDGDLVVVISAAHRTKETLRKAFQLASQFCKEDKLEAAEAWDRRNNVRLAGARGAKTKETKV